MTTIMAIRNTGAPAASPTSGVGVGATAGTVVGVGVGVGEAGRVTTVGVVVGATVGVAVGGDIVAAGVAVGGACVGVGATGGRGGGWSTCGCRRRRGSDGVQDEQGEPTRNPGEVGCADERVAADVAAGNDAEVVVLVVDLGDIDILDSLAKRPV